MIERSHLKKLTSRIIESRKFIQVIIGPRQVGKTTMVAQLLKKINTPSLFESADSTTSADPLWIEQIWEAARIKMKVWDAKEFLIVIDEIQKVRNWSETVKLLWDRDTLDGINIKLVLSGSSRLLLNKGLTESLAGRF